MIDDILPVDFETKEESMIKVIGVGGGGSNAVNHMYKEGIKDVGFVICNTDSQALIDSPIPLKIQLGKSLTEGRGAGNKPEKGRQSAIESIDDVNKLFGEKTKMVFITAGMGGGTGTGAAPVIAELAKEKNILTVGIVTIPFLFEGKRRVQQALEGIENLEKHVDALLIINNEKLRSMFGDLKLSEAFAQADSVLSIAAKSIAEIITVHGYVNVDFADVETVMRNSGVAIMGSASLAGEDRAIKAIKQALNSPLLNSNNIYGARNILLNIISGAEEATMTEVTDITEYVQAVVGNDVNIIWGNGYSESCNDELSVTIIATGFTDNPIPELNIQPREHELNKAPQLELIIENPEMLEAEANNSKRKTTAPKMKNLNQTETVEAYFEDEEIVGEIEEKVNESKSNNSFVAAQAKEVKKDKKSGWFKDTLGSLFDTEDTSM
ncbi:cell division protein FtsZ [Ancylomarina euxinus]|uniref:Cell division protein FtsZ n=1 Tax=Ancylomarina euxinus TaxID=2283627 RepID=A0A425Y0U1_9BACT|nr:cell division protein FtsZ [Ancylomarina euxinus]MCZ4693821.1 cell division protein FtsZ [Ancylomarina euxinus]MUP15100.1 cell division protein FtsZ [Ancylomarina euxinus]RRG21522.1 cell division protein FtsZ [Ancylomarina euxinus]